MSDDPDSSTGLDTPHISIAVTVSVPAWQDTLPGAEALARRAAAVGAARAGTAPDRDREVSLVLADDATLRKLNLEYRGVDKPTNVLSFAACAEPRSNSTGPLLLGDVLIAYETVHREAEQQGKRVSDHLCHLVVHGVLHLLGYDHANEREAARMERLETAILAELGVADPYRQSVPS